MQPVAFAIAAFAVVAGCGRIDFDSRADADGPPATAPAVCDPVEVGAVAIAGAPVALRAVPGGGGTTAVLIGTDAGNIYAVRVSAQRVVESVHLPLTDSYVLHGAGEVGGNVFIHADFPPTDAYVKRLDPSWDTYGTMDSGQVGAVDPPVAMTANGSKAVQGIVRAGSLALREIDPIGNELQFLGAVAAVGGTIAVHADGARIVADAGDGTCLLIEFPAITDTRITDCATPRFPSHGDATYLLHTRPGAQAFLARELATGTTHLLDGDRGARAAVVDGALWVASLRAAQPRLAVLESGGVSEASAAFTAPMDFAPSGDLVWYDNGKLHAGRVCLR